MLITIIIDSHYYHQFHFEFRPAVHLIHFKFQKEQVSFNLYFHKLELN
jgi:hypothetical protein